MGATSFLSFFVFFMSFGNQSGSEFLDYIDSKAYWDHMEIAMEAEALLPLIAPPTTRPPAEIQKLIAQLGDASFSHRKKADAELAAIGAEAAPYLREAENSKDPEIKERARKLLEKMNLPPEPGSLQHLLAIRSLGELKATEAIPALEKLVENPTPFADLYARRALAHIRGDDPKTLFEQPKFDAKDLNLMPNGCRGVMHMKFPNHGAVDIRKMMNDILKMMGPLGGPGMNVNDMMSEMTRGMTEFGNKMGNFRIDSVTVFISDKIDNDNGSMSVILHGLCHAEKIRQTLRDEGMRVLQDGGLKWFVDEVAICPVDNHTLLFLAAAEMEDLKELRAFARRVNQPRGGPPQPGIAKFLDRVDRDQLLWGSMEPNEFIKDEFGELAKGITRIDVEANKFKQGVGASYATGIHTENEAKATELLKQMEGGVTMLKGMMAAEFAAIPGAKDLKAIVDSIKLQRDGGMIRASITIREFPFSALMPMFMFGAGVPGPVP